MAFISGQYDLGREPRMTMTRSGSASPAAIPVSCSCVCMRVSKCVRNWDSSSHFITYKWHQRSTFTISVLPSCFAQTCCELFQDLIFRYENPVGPRTGACNGTRLQLMHCAAV